ncbi:PREDICTED: ectonucleoside triphosphate diphosphohydrolase 1 isoform X1 [Thamnophis sirtalis]|uniref:Ectonucleoside triphosphate diphosphohydrolase 1 n=2 Tax=Thamnophis sirtalis TaxID=35019 RepID=A0A6I9X1A4_9SAUR|nr:PREDICTED: ectonucleoside triphosphate diphosphohydrolase 1 isoform X1 [Thamnophis sirtalis]XP_013907603.1 PREDICTED: ectonucleoside triphosphate diphosphohydrolase 1 isoform X1 [Thamnophis sirtalis]XP_013907604.1 PREDICTED: ectonucleoside triphosphate diphosphohydrolase 1 isoform X1 [Thamnophis sirtalis]
MGIMLRKYCHLKYIIVGLLLVVALITLITVAITQNLSSTRNHKYGIVLDAGSSHTSLYIYEWPAEKENNTGMVHQLEVCDVEGPGISSYANAVENVSVPLKHCMDSAKEIVPQGKHQETPVYLGATAGMRLLSLKNKDAAKRVLSTVEETLRIYPFKFQGARILSGEEEGAYGWITLNYLLGKFTESSWPRVFADAFFKSGTTGALDLGGASTQITFVPDPDKIELPTNIINFHLYGKEYMVYTHSFLCYGKDQALQRKLLQDVLLSKTDRLHDPCFHQGYERTLNVFDLTTNPCTAHNITPTYSQIQIQGDGNYEKCLESIQRIFNTEECLYSSCSFNGTFLPEVSGEFGAFSAFYYVMNFLNVTKKPMDQVIETVKNFCSKPWNEVKVEFPKAKEKYLSEYCFSSTYIISLLGQRYNFTKEKWQTIHFLKKIGNSDAGWTLGYMLNLTNMIPAEQPYTHLLSHTGFISFMVLCSALVMTLLLIGWIIYHKPKCLRKEII